MESIECLDEQYPLYDDDDDDDDGNNDTMTRNRHKNYKKRKRKKQYSDSEKKSANNVTHLEIVGTCYNIHRNDAMAQSLDDGNHLINYWEDRENFYMEKIEDTKMTYCDKIDFVHPNPLEQDLTEVRQLEPVIKGPKSLVLLMDRYDARSLLDDGSSLLPRPNESDNYVSSASTTDFDGNEELEELLSFERYGLLKEYSLIFNHEKKDKVTTIQETTQRQKHVMNVTAKKCAIMRQFEATLKLKQSSNTEFGFLFEDNSLHQYYLMLRRKYSAKPAQLDDENPSTVGINSEFSLSHNGCDRKDNCNSTSDDNNISAIENEIMDNEKVKSDDEIWEQLNWDKLPMGMVMVSISMVYSKVISCDLARLQYLDYFRYLEL